MYSNSKKDGEYLKFKFWMRLLSFNFAQICLDKGMNPSILPPNPAMDK